MADKQKLELEDNTVLTEDDRTILDSAEGFLSDGLALKRWFEATQQSGSFANRFESMHTYNRSDRSFGFFGEAPLDKGTMPVMGLIDDVFYDFPKGADTGRGKAVEIMKAQIREFVLHYFLRISDYRQPERAPDPEAEQVPSYLRPLSWRAEADIHRSGMEFTQRYYKSAATGKIGKFEGNEVRAVADLRHVGSKYSWMILQLKIFDFTITVKPAGNTGPQVQMPLKEESYLIVTPDFITDRESPEPGIAGEYGFGYAFIKNPGRGPFAYGPGEFEAAFQTINFRVLDTGEVRVRMPFVSNRPDKIMNFSLDPVDWGLNLADRLTLGIGSSLVKPIRAAWQEWAGMTGPAADPVVAGINVADFISMGQSSKQLNITLDQLNRGFLVRHSLQHYMTVFGSLRTWRQIPDWRSESLPEWVVDGNSS